MLHRVGEHHKRQAGRYALLVIGLADLSGQEINGDRSTHCQQWRRTTSGLRRHDDSNGGDYKAYEVETAVKVIKEE